MPDRPNDRDNRPNSERDNRNGNTNDRNNRETRPTDRNRTEGGTARLTPEQIAQQEAQRRRDAQARLDRSRRNNRLNYRNALNRIIPDQNAMTIATHYAPYVFLDEDESYYPSSVSWYLSWVNLIYEDENNIITEQVTPETLIGDYPVNGVSKNTAEDGKFEFRIKHLPGRIGEVRAYKVDLETECYAHIRPVYKPYGLDTVLLDIQYWFFYPYNEPLFKNTTKHETPWKRFTNAFDAFIAGFAKKLADEHEADWECITVRINMQTTEITEIFFAKHGLANQWVKRIKKIGHRPVVFSGKGSHASFPGMGTHPDEQVANKVEEAFRSTHHLLPKEIFDGAAMIAKQFILDETDYGTRWDTSKNLVLLKDNVAEDNENSWNRFAGKWGVAGPTSPGLKTSWRYQDPPLLLANNCWSEPVLDGDYLYYQGGQKDNETLCRIRKDGLGQEEIIDDKCGSSPFVHGDYVYFQGGTNRDQLWRRKKDGSGHAEFLDEYCGYSPCVDGEHVFYAGGSNRNDLYRIRVNGAGGAQKVDNNCFSRPFVDGDYVYFQGSGDKDGLYRRRKDDSRGGAGDAEKLDSHCHSTPFVYDDYIYYQGKNSKLYRIKKDGSGSAELLDPHCHFSPYLYNNYIYFVGSSHDPNLYWLPVDGSTNAQLFATNCVSAAVVDGANVYYRGIDGDENTNYGLYWTLDMSLFM